MGNGDYSFGKKSSYGYNTKPNTQPRGKSTSKKSTVVPSLGTSHFPPLGASANAKRFSKEEILAAKETPEEVTLTDTDDNPVLNLANEPEVSQEPQGDLKDDIVESKWVDNQRRSRSTQRRRPTNPPPVSKSKTRETTARSTSVSREREVKETEVETKAPTEEKTQQKEQNEEQKKLNWASIARASGN